MRQFFNEEKLQNEIDAMCKKVKEDIRRVKLNDDFEGFSKREFINELDVFIELKIWMV